MFNGSRLGETSMSEEGGMFSSPFGDGDGDSETGESLVVDMVSSIERCQGRTCTKLPALEVGYAIWPSLVVKRQDQNHVMNAP